MKYYTLFIINFIIIYKYAPIIRSLRAGWTRTQSYSNLVGPVELYVWNNDVCPFGHSMAISRFNRTADDIPDADPYNQRIVSSELISR